MKTSTYQITVDAKYPATVAITTDDNGQFAAVIHSDEFGVGSAHGAYGTNNHYWGKVTLDDHTAEFSADLNGEQITGSIRYGWFFHLKFAGKLQA